MLEIFQFTKDFSKEYKYTVGENIKKQTIELLTLIFRANSRKDKQQVLQEARESIEIIRLFIRLMKDMHQISLKRFVQVNKKVEDVSKQLTEKQKQIKHSTPMGSYKQIEFLIVIQLSLSCHSIVIQ